MTRCRPKLVLALGTVRLARTCVRPLPAQPVERPDYAPLSHTVNQIVSQGPPGARRAASGAERRPDHAMLDLFRPHAPRPGRREHTGRDPPGVPAGRRHLRPNRGGRSA
jgi:hypothetical protein